MHQVCLTNLCLKSLKVSSLQDWILLRFGSQLKPPFGSDKSVIIQFLVSPCYCSRANLTIFQSIRLTMLTSFKTSLTVFHIFADFRLNVILIELPPPLIALHSFLLNRMNFLFQYENSSLFIIKTMEPILQIYVVCWICMTRLYIYDLMGYKTLTYRVKKIPFY